MRNCKGASIIIYRVNNKKVEVLLGKRKYFPNIGSWTIPGGKMESFDNEDYEKTAVRECFEETGIKVVNNLILIDKIRDNNFKWNTYLYKTPSNTKNLFKEEVTESAWFDVNNLPKPLIPLLNEQIKNANFIIL